jgi:DNA-binding NarL/FixJ family response regulator
MSWQKLRARYTFTPTELEVLEYFILGYTCPQIAELTCRSVRTVEDHKGNIREKLHISKPYENWRIIRWAIDNGLVEINF